MVLQVHHLFQFEVKNKSLDWIGALEALLSIMNNVTLDKEACAILTEDGLVNTIKDAMNSCSEEAHNTIRSRCILTLSKLTKYPEAVIRASQSKEIVVRLFLFMNRNFPDLFENCIRVLHPMLKMGETFNQHVEEFKINKSIFAKEIAGIVLNATEEQNMPLFINSSACAAATMGCLGIDLAEHYSDLIIPLWDVLQNHTGMERKNAAVLLASMTKHEESKRKIRECHAMDLLMNLSSHIAKPE